MSGAELCPHCPAKSGQDQLIADDPQTNELNKCLLLYATEQPNTKLEWSVMQQ